MDKFDLDIINLDLGTILRLTEAANFLECSDLIELTNASVIIMCSKIQDCAKNPEILRAKINEIFDPLEKKKPIINGQ